MQETPAQSSASILYVEDDEDLAEEVAEALREHHRFVKAVGTGRDAQNALNSEHFDLIILDWQLPDVDGIEVLKDFRQRGGTTPILMLTGMKDIDCKEAGLDAGADDYLLKPCDPRELFARIRRLLKRNPPAVCQPANHFPPPSTLPESPTPALSGATITSGLHDQYIIGDKLGQGTAGVVFKAQHRFLNRSLAIKILQPASIVDPATVTRFKREASLVSTLNHPNIVSVYECGVSALGLPFLVMEYLEGKSLNDILEIEGRLEPNRMLPLFLQACEALQHAHDLGIVHRDLKPSNIMISRLSDGKERLKLVDFGIAKAIESEDDTLTREGAFVGTPLYMSPEQVKGEGLDSRSDIFSLGCVMYETLTGHKPFMGSNMFHTLLKRTIETAKPMSEVCPQHNVPEALENIVFKAMAIMRCDRYQTIACLKDDLSALKI